MKLAIVSKRRKEDPNIRWFGKARFGMFIHFGLYALLGRGEWVMYHERIPRREYERLAKRFNPTRFDADEWVDLAISAGARYIAVTAKHHDGFCMFDSRHTDYKATNTPFGRDLIGELIRACHKRRMKIVLYYSQPDWHHPNYVHRRGAFKDLQNPQPGDQPDWGKYQEYLENQVLELITRYGRMDGIWFDGSHKSERDWRGRRLYRLIKRHQPWAVVNDRARYGDFFTPERSLPEDLTGYLFEACESVDTTSWGYKEKGSALHNVPYLVESLVRMAAAGGNYLLNVGPKPDGTIPAEQARRMREIGKWLRRNGEAIYGTRECRIVTGSPDILATRADLSIYLHLLRWPSRDRLLIPGVRSRPIAVQLIGCRKPLEARLTAAGLEIAGIPALPVEASVNVIRLRFDSPPRLHFAKGTRPTVKTVRLQQGRLSFLSAAEAQLHGFGVKGTRLRLRTSMLEGGAHREARPCISGWSALEQFATWKVSSPRRQQYRVAIRLSCPEPYAGSKFAIEVRGSRLLGHVRTTRSFDDFDTQPIGTITLPKGTSAVSLKATYLPYGYVFADIQGIELKPVRGR
jgi:alpha-L-fucosidase